jgi:hypothetical protein
MSIFISGNILGQCCSAGNPFFYGELSSLSKKNLQLVTGYKYGTAIRYFSGSDPIDIKFVDQAWFNYLTFQVIYGLTERLTIQGDIGYFMNKTETYLKEDWATSKGFGMGDANITFKYLAYSNFKKHIQIVPAIGVTLPVGVFDQEVNHVKLPITVQPSSGSFKYQVSLFIIKGTKNSKFNFTLFGMYEYAQLINSGNFYYKYGNQLLFSFLTSYNLTRKLSFALELRNENRARAIRNDDQTVESSGFSLIYLIPHLSWAFYNNWFIAVNSDIPVYKYYNGIQLSHAFSVSVRLSYTINFGKKDLREFNVN